MLNKRKHLDLKTDNGCLLRQPFLFLNLARCAALIFALVSAERCLPRFAALVFAIASAERCLPRRDVLNFALVSADTGALCFHASRIFALVSSERCLPLRAALIFALVSAEGLLPVFEKPGHTVGSYLFMQRLSLISLWIA